MVRFLILSLAIVLLTAPELISSHNYVVDVIANGVIRLEPADNNDQKVQYIEQRHFPHLKEGQVVRCFILGKWIIKVTPDAAQTSARQAEVAAILTRIATPIADFD